MLSSAAQKSNKDRDKFRTTTCIVLEDQKARWVRLKVALKVKSDHKLAEVLLDTSVCQLPCRVVSPVPMLRYYYITRSRVFYL